MPFNSLLTEDKLRNRVIYDCWAEQGSNRREKEGGRKEGKKKEEEKEEWEEERHNSEYIIQDKLRCAAITNYPKSQWLKTTKVYFLLTVHIHRGSAGVSAPRCPKSGTQADGASTIWNIIMGGKKRVVSHALTQK